MLMLRIKETVRFEDLEKFGFKKVVQLGLGGFVKPVYEMPLNSCDLKIYNSRRIAYSNYMDADLDNNDDDLLIVLFEMIKKGFVEEVITEDK